MQVVKIQLQIVPNKVFNYILNINYESSAFAVYEEHPSTFDGFDTFIKTLCTVTFGQNWNYE